MSEEKKEEPKATRGRKKISEEKLQEAKNRVKDLLKDTPVASIIAEEPIVVPPSATEFADHPINTNIEAEKNIRWLEKEVERLTTQVQQQEDIIVSYKHQLDSIKQQGGGGVMDMNNSPDRAQVVQMFKLFENQYVGNNPQRARYTMVRLSWPQSSTGVLDTMLNLFPYLHEVKRYKHDLE